MSNYFCVNKSGSSVPVYSDYKKTSKIGTIYPRESFIYNAGWGGDYVYDNIYFRNSSGKIVNGFLVSPPEKALVNCTTYPYGTLTIDGKTYKTFLMRLSQKIYTVDAEVWGAVAANRRVACLNALTGDSHPCWKQINYVENSSGAWVPVKSDTKHAYGYVNTNLAYASSYSSVPFYGKW